MEARALRRPKGRILTLLRRCQAARAQGVTCIYFACLSWDIAASILGTKSKPILRKPLSVHTVVQMAVIIEWCPGMQTRRLQTLLACRRPLVEYTSDTVVNGCTPVLINQQATKQVTYHELQLSFSLTGVKICSDAPCTEQNQYCIALASARQAVLAAYSICAFKTIDH